MSYLLVFNLSVIEQLMVICTNLCVTTYVLYTQSLQPSSIYRTQKSLNLHQLLHIVHLIHMLRTQVKFKSNVIFQWYIP